MSEIAPASPSAVTLVAQDHHDLENALIGSVLQEATLTADHVRWLSRKEGQLAVEAVIADVPRDDVRLKALHAACADICKTGVDFAWTPPLLPKNALTNWQTLPG